MTKTKYKYITYRADRKQYQVKVSIAGETITKTVKTLHEALIIRMELLRARATKTGETFILTKNGILQRQMKRNVEISMTAWYKSQKFPFIERATHTRYSGFMRNYIFPKIGSMDPSEVTHDVIQAFAVALCDRVCVLTVKAVISLLRQYFTYLGGANPCIDVMYRRERKAKKRRDAFTREQQRKLLSLVKNDSYNLYFLLNMYFETGCRRGELIACKWNQLDFCNGTLHIEPTLVDNGKGGVICKPYPKNTASIRDIPLTKKTLFILRSIYDKRKKYTHNIDDRYIFLTQDNKPVRPETLTLAFKRYRDMADLPDTLTLHSTRHTFASRLMKAGIPIHVICKIGGWESSSTLLNVYTHVSQNEVRNAVYKIL